MRFQPVLHFGNASKRMPISFPSYLEARAFAVEICTSHPLTDTFSIEPAIEEEPNGKT